MSFFYNFLPDYSEPLYRPPSESRSLIFQITEGCSHNKCTFCGMYIDKQFRLKPVNEVFREIDKIPNDYALRVDKIFLADGDAVIYPTDRLIIILDKMNEKFPNLKRISSYAGARELVLKSVHEWRELAHRKLTLIYFGMESGNNTVRKLMNKGYDVEEFIGTLKEISSFIDLSIMIILGGGGRKYSKEHALDTARVISEVSPRYASLLTLFMRRNRDYFQNIETPTMGDLMEESKTVISNIGGSNITFRSNHISNFVSLSGILPDDREKLVSSIDKGIARLKAEGLYDMIPDYYMEDC